MLTKKLELAKQQISQKCGCKTGCPKCGRQLRFVAQMAEACIPVVYWELKMNGFSGAENIRTATTDYMSDVKQRYQDGAGICFAGTLGTGKTYGIANILKAALAGDFSAHYCCLADVVAGLTSSMTRANYSALLLSVDFLAIDEVDSRHISASEQAQDLFGTSFERILRHRVQNKLPIIMATNNASIEEAFTGQFRRVIESLGTGFVQVVPALGKDYRLARGKE
jgi:DNA replication protein DnaC